MNPLRRLKFNGTDLLQGILNLFAGMVSSSMVISARIQSFDWAQLKLNNPIQKKKTSSP